MRRIIFLALLAAAPALAETSHVRVPNLPNPAGCANYEANATGVPGDACNAAIDAETDLKVKSVMLFRRAFIFDAPGDFGKYPAALADLDLAIKLYPGNWLALHERSYLYVEYGRYADAVADLTAQIALAPDVPDGYRERALARFNLGDLEGAYADRDATIKAGDEHAGAYLARARAAMWLGRFDDAGGDIAAADTAGLTSSDAQERASLEAELAMWRASGDAERCVMTSMPGPEANPNLVADCTQAFLTAKALKDRTDALTVRSEGWLMLSHDRDKRFTDSKIAAALDPANPALQSNFGFVLLDMRHSRAAMDAFDRSIAIEPSFVAFAGRASANFNLGDLDGAEADATKSNALRENDVALTILGDVSYSRTHDYDKAKTFWLRAYALGDRDDGLKARLKAAGVTPGGH